MSRPEPISADPSPAAGSPTRSPAGARVAGAASDRLARRRLEPATGRTLGGTRPETPSGRHRAVEDLARDSIHDVESSPERHLSPLNLVLVVSAVAIAAVGQVLLRHGMRVAASQTAGGGSLAWHAVTSPSVLGGLLVFGLSAALWLAALSRVPLSIAYPFNALGYIGILTMSAVVLHEHVAVRTWVGSMVVVLGLLLVVSSAKSG